MPGRGNPKPNQARNNNKPARATRRDIEESLTPESMSALHGYAKKRCRTLRILGVRLGSEVPADLVAQAIADTLAGQLTWRPSACKLTTHLIQTIKTRTHKLMKGQRSIQHIYPENDNAWEAITTDHAPPPDKHHLLHEELANLLAEIETEFATRGDRDVLNITAAWRSGHLARADVVASAEMIPTAYDNARARIHRWIEAREEAKET